MRNEPQPLNSPHGSGVKIHWAETKVAFAGLVFAKGCEFLLWWGMVFLWKEGGEGRGGVGWGQARENGNLMRTRLSKLPLECRKWGFKRWGFKEI